MLKFVLIHSNYTRISINVYIKHYAEYYCLQILTKFRIRLSELINLMKLDGNRFSKMSYRKRYQLPKLNNTTKVES